MSYGPEYSQTQPSKQYGYVLSVLLSLFCVRVLAQLIQAIYPMRYLPAFSTWQSGALPYEILLASQFLIIVLCTMMIWKLTHGTTKPALRMGKIYLYSGGFYFCIMAFRLLIGLTIAPDHFWYSAHLPTLFHMVLATFVIVYGHFHYTGSMNRRHPHKRKKGCSFMR